MSLRWLVEERKDAPRWPSLLPLALLFLLAAAAAYEIGKEALDIFVWGLLHGHPAALVLLTFAVVCYVQWRRPTVLGWSLTFTPTLVCTLLLGFSISWYNDWEAGATALLGGVSAAFLFLFRPVVMSKRRALALTVLCVVLCGGFAGTEKYREATTKPMGSPPMIVFPQNVSLAEKERTLNGDFLIATKMKKLPPAIQALYREKNGSRFAIADAGKKFEDSDDITDSSLPGRGLIFAGVSQERCFVYHAEGGFVESFHVEAFALPDAKPLWESYVGSQATDLPGLRKRLDANDCCTPK